MTPQVPRVFLSYNVADRRFAERLGKDLLKAGIDVWRDKWDLLAGESIPEGISEAIQRCSAFAVIMTPSSMRSRWVKAELSAAIAKKIAGSPGFVIPILLETCRVPALLQPIKYVDFREGYSAGLLSFKSSVLGQPLKPPLGRPPTAGSKTWQFLRWEVDVRIKNTKGDAEYQTTVVLKNISRKRQILSPMHSVWAPTPAGIAVDQIRAYDASTRLRIDTRVSRVVGSFTFFQVIADRPVPPGGCWRYWFEITWPLGFPDLFKRENYTYKGEENVEELILKLVMPTGSHVAEGAQVLKGASKAARLQWLKLHGCNALVVWKDRVPVGETLELVFHLKHQ